MAYAAYDPYAQDKMYQQYLKSTKSAANNVAQMPVKTAGMGAASTSISSASPSYQNHVSYFGSPQAYAAEIQRKESAGGTLSDPAAAAAFKSANPQYFSPAPKPTSTYEAQRRDLNMDASAADIEGLSGLATGLGFTQDEVNKSWKTTIPEVGNFYSMPYNLATTALQAAPPVAPNMQVQYQMQPYMSMDEALKRAGEQLSPTEELNRMNLLKTYMEQREKLPQYLNARGQAFGGLRAGLETELTQDEARSLDELSLRGAAEKQGVAQAMYQGDFDRAQSLSDRLFQQEQLNAQLANQQWQAQMQSFNQEKSQKANTALALAELMQQQQARQAAAAQDAYNFNNLSAWQQAQLTQGNVNSDLERQLLEARIAETQRAANAPYSSGGGTSGGLTEYQKWQIQQTEKENAATAPNYTFEYLSAVPTYTSREQALGELKKYETIMKQRGVDPKVILAEIDRLFPAKNTTSFKMPSNEALMNLVPGMPRY